MTKLESADALVSPPVDRAQPGNATPAIAPDWPALLDQLIVGVAHELSNRVATLAGVSDLLAGDPAVPPILRSLADEVPRLEEALRLLRLLTAPEDEPAEPLEPARVMDDALALARLHPEAKRNSYDVQLPARLPPILACPTRITHALVGSLVRASAAPGRPLRVRVAAAEGDVVFLIGDERIRVPVLTRRSSAPAAPRPSQ